MGGCVSNQFAEEEPNDSTCEEWSMFYERRIEDALLSQFVVAAPFTSKLPLDCLIGDVPCERLSHNILFFEWDDTLFPSTWAQKKGGFRSNGRVAQAFQKQHKEQLISLSSVLVSLLTEVQRLGKVVIVTRASQSWVATCRSMLTPEAQAILQQIPLISVVDMNKDLVSSSETAILPEKIVRIELKARAMRVIISSFHKTTSESCGPINVVSVGDTQCQRVAMREFIRSGAHGTRGSNCCFTKTIKMQGHPSLVQMLSQLSMIAKWFSAIVHADTHVNIDLATHM